jgi:hypothetical protein
VLLIKVEAWNKEMVAFTECIMQSRDIVTREYQLIETSKKSVMTMPAISFTSIRVVMQQLKIRQGGAVR